MKPVVLKKCFADPLLEVMNFLNEVVLDYPHAISFAPGRPLETLFDVENHFTGIQQFIERKAHDSGISQAEAWQDLGQYNRTNGSINAAIAAQLSKDEGIQTCPESIMVTVGAQEAMAVILAGLFDPRDDVLLVSDPTYIGITGLAHILGIRIMGVPSGEDGLQPLDVRKAIAKAKKLGRPRALYDIPDFNNPLGGSLSVERRIEILEICREEEVLYLEDNPYGMFFYDSERLPTLKSLDRNATVIYIGSYSKTLFPGLRVGYLVADQRVEGTDRTLAQELSKVKSLITVNTPGICQAMVANAIGIHGDSLEPLVAPKRAQFRLNRDVMIECLSREFGDLKGVTWNRPGGGFFLTLELPFEFGVPELKQCAADYGVIVCPMSFFSLWSGRRSQVRLSFSYVTPDEIVLGIERLSHFCRVRIDARSDVASAGATH
jgi:(S)-3,5-dihydroxyphenylglycine transaminase